MIGTDAFQEVDTFGLNLPITKHNFLVRSAAELLEVIPRAFRIAVSGRAGPVLVDVPKDVQTEIGRCRFFSRARPRRSAAAVPARRSCAAPQRMINAAQKPLLLIGAGSHRRGRVERFASI